MIPERIRYQRARELAGIARLQSDTYVRSWVGKEVEVLFERGKGRRLQGISGNYLKVEVEGAPKDALGKLARVEISASYPTCTGRFHAFCS
jgi:tRNA A37 methylthiotransferase MiaB